MRRMFATAVTVGAIVVAGCAGVDYRKVDAWTDKTAGVRYYMPEPYLSVTRVAPKPVRIDPVAKQTFSITNGGTNSMPVGVLVGLDPATKVKLTLPVNAYLVFDDSQSHETTVKADAATKAVQARVKLAAPVTGPLELTLEASYEGMNLCTLKVELAAKPGAPPGAEVTVSGAQPSAAAYTTTIVYLPNRDRILAAEPFNGIGGSTELSLKLKDGWMLTETGAKSDTQADETLSAFASLVEQVGGIASGFRETETDTRAEAPPQDLSGLYRPIYSSDGSITEFRRVPLIFGS